MAMAQSGSCPNPDLSNGAIVHIRQPICSDLDTQKGRGNEEGQEEEEEVELAEEVGEDVLMMAEPGEEQAERESGQHSEREEVGIIQVDLLPNGVIEEGDGGSETLTETVEGGVEEEDRKQEKLDKQTRKKEGEDKTKEESKDTNAVVGNQCHFSPLIKIENGQEQISNRNKENEEDGGNEGNKEETASPEEEVKEEQINKGDNGLDEHQIVSTTDDAETIKESSIVVEEAVKATQSSTDDTYETEVAVLSTNGEVETTEGPTTHVDSVTTGIDEEITIQLDPCQISTVWFGTIEVPSTINQTDQLPSENIDNIKHTDERDSEFSKKVVDSITWQQTDSVEAKVEVDGTTEFVKDVQSASDAVLDIEAETNLEVAQPQLAFEPLEAQSQTEGRIEEIRLGGINQKAQEEEQVRQVGVNTLKATDGGGKTTEEEWKTSDNVVRVLMGEEEHRRTGDKGMQEESSVQFENQAMVALAEPTVQFVEEVPLDGKQDVDLDQVEEAFELEEQGEGELDQPEGEVTSEDNESTAEGLDLQEHPTQLLRETGTDWRDTLKDQSRNQVIVEDERGRGTLEEAMVEEVEMAEEPVTVLDDEIEEIEESRTSELEEQEPANMTVAPSEDANVKTKDEESQELVMKTKLDKDNDGKKKDEKGKVSNDKKPKDDIREVELDINGKVKELRQAMENGILCPEPLPLRKEGWGTARVRSPRRKDNDWIKNDQLEDKREPEVKDWRKELKPVKKDIWENERGRKEWVEKDSLPEEKSPPKKDDWIKELKSVIKDESVPKKRGEQVKKKRVVLLEDGHSYIPQKEEITEEKKDEVKLISHKRVESPLPYVRRNSKTPQDQDYEISLYVKVKNTHTLIT